ncbi:hypothetical protein GCM10011297_18030 [Bacterioplanes sanyensis]|uniref:hypothetical protein n=1 Tax=Bacterioplanes sanyensis TaxID=1249553 RepID=UPI00167A34E0|nr:hypothetical protein [Bacterioplanes sanyensis]GGY45686.1 hypothetical protein GCM10011297_18030 [Bacterioplanes sanyensis]
MAEVHIKEIMKYLGLALKGEEGSPSNHHQADDFFLELKFNDPDGKKSGIVDEDFKNETITVDCPYGSVTILFDDEGQLKSIEIC